MKLRLSVLSAALATSAVFAGTYSALDQPTPPATGPSNEIVITEKETIVATPQDTVVAIEPIAAPAPVVEERQPVPVVERAATVAEPPITVVEQRLTEDERIQAAVMDVLASNPGYSGKVGVESKDRVVMLSGYLMTQGQVWRAGRDAHVQGVRYVVNEIRPQVGTVRN